jgi:putative DNA primase/helicase
MANNLDQTGVVQVNGAWATSIRFELNAENRNADAELDLRFMQGRAEALRIGVPRSELVELLGENNRATIEKQILNAPQGEEIIKGELRGTQLHYRELTLDASGPQVVPNAIEVVRHRAIEPNNTSATVGVGAADVMDASPVGTATERDPGDGKERIDARRRAAAEVNPLGTKAERAPVPDHIASKYLVKDDKYHFDDKTVAFVDKGSKLTVETHNKAVIQDLIAIAKARDWQEIRVTGAEAFRREVWKEAFAAGLDVKGYKPSDLELQASNKERVRRGTPNKWSALDRRPPNVDAPSASTRAQNARDQSKELFFGTLVAHGEAPYQNDPTKSASYYVTLRDEAGRERSHWGVGLEAAIKDAQTAPVVGEQVGIQRVGATPVTVPSSRVDAHGAVVTEQINAQRNQWVVEKIDYFKAGKALANEAQARASSATVQRPLAAATAEVGPTTVVPQGMTREQEVAAAIRSAATTREELQLKYPELNKAVFSHLASHDQFARAFVEAGLIRESDRAQVIAQMRERLAGQVEHGAPIQEPDNRQIATLIRRSVNRVAADIGRSPVEALPERSAERVMTPKTPVREDPQVRA